jgi:hypothetical protein
MIEFSVTKKDNGEYDLSSYLSRGRFALVHSFSKMAPDGIVTRTINFDYFLPKKKVGEYYITEKFSNEDIKNAVKLYKKYGDKGYKNFTKDDKGFIKYIKDMKESETNNKELIDEEKQETIEKRLKRFMTKSRDKKRESNSLKIAKKNMKKHKRALDILKTYDES